jgi:hypothetical protein
MKICGSDMKVYTWEGFREDEGMDSGSIWYDTNELLCDVKSLVFLGVTKCYIACV